MTESLSYTLLCVLAWCLLRIGQRSLAPARVLGAVALAALLVLTRVQFAFLIPVLVLLLVLALRAASTAVRARLLLGTLAIAGAAAAVQGAYTYAKLGQSSRVATTGVQLLTVVAYNSRPAHADGLSDPAARAYAHRLLERLHEQRLLATDRGPLTTAQHFAYNRICYDHVIALYADSTGQRELSAAQMVALDAFTSRVAFGLLKGSWRRYATHVATLIHQVHKYFAYLAAALCLLGAVALRSRTSRASSLVLLAAAAGWWTNVLSVGAVQYPQTRYTFYFDTLLTAVVLAILAGTLEANVSSSTRPTRAARSG